jgi:Fur family transcriptional regulator, ferric uptake regulator
MQISIKSSGKYAALLRDAGFRATYGRVALLAELERTSKPLRVETAAKAVKGKLDLTNTYRALEALSEAGLVRRVDLGHAHTHYALASRGPHAHRFVCASCGLPKSV